MGNLMRVRDWKDRFRGRRGYVLGNGPSLKGVDLMELKRDGVVFGSNRVYLTGQEPDVYACVNPLVLEQFGEEIEALTCAKFLPAWWVEKNKGVGGQVIGNGRYTKIDTSLNFPLFGSPEGCMWEGHTVTFVLLQLAFYMGIEEVVLLGVDHYYGAVEHPNREVLATGADEYHFNGEYFGKGTRWNLPDLEQSEIAYSLARAAFEREGRRVVNASGRTRLRVFEVKAPGQLGTWAPGMKQEAVFDYGEERPATPKGVRVSAIVSAYKCSEWLVGRLENLAGQTEAPEVVMVAQKGSVEEKICRGFTLQYEPTVLVLTDDIPTVYRAWNLGIGEAKGRYLTNANSDDRLHPEALRVMADLLDGRPDIDVVYPDVFVTWTAGESFAEFAGRTNGKALKLGRWEGEDGYFAWPAYDRGLLGKGCYIGPMPMWRANLHQLYGGFQDSYKVAGDYEFWLRVAREENMLHVPAFLGIYTARLDGVELGNPSETADESAQAMLLHQEAEGVEFSPAGMLVRVDLGGKWTFVEPGALAEVVGAVLGGGREQ